MKNITTFARAKAALAFLICGLLFSATASAKKIYPVKGADNSVYIYGPTYNFAPGDTFVLKASSGPYSFMELISVNGTASAPVVVINEGGQVNISQFRIRHSRYLKVRGIGSSSHNYGFYMTSPHLYQTAFDITGRSANVEVNNIDINTMGYGFFIKQEAACEDSLQAPNWVLDNISVHDCRITNIYQEGFYAGSTAPNGERSIVCNGVTKYPIPPRLGNIRIYNNIIDKTGRGAIQLSGAPYGNNEIYNNTISNSGTELNDWQGNGIVLGAYTSAYIHHNNINQTLSSGIFALGAGLIRIENNTINNSGSLYGKTVAHSSNIYMDTRLTNPVMPLQFIIKDNLLGAMQGDKHIRVYKGLYPYATSGNVMCNNNLMSGGPAIVLVETGINYTGCTTSNQAPVVSAGSAQTITLPVASVTLNGTATDADGTISSYQWTQVSGPAPALIASVGSLSTVVSGLVAGTYTFKLTATDNSGAAGSANVSVTVNPLTSTGGTPSTTTTVKVEAESYAQMNGIQTENTQDAGGGLNVGWQDNNDWMDYNVNLASAGSYTINFRVASYFTGAQFQVRTAAGTILKTMTVPNTGSFQNWQTITTSVTLPAGQQTIRIFTNAANGGWNFNWMEFTGSSTSGGSNQVPVANAGADQTITLPTSSASLTGSGTDADGSVSAYAWSMVSGPAAATFSNAAAANTTVSALVAGTYTFRLTVTDNAGATGTDDVVVTVNSSTTTTSPSTTTVKVEAESYAQMNGIQTENTQDAGGGLNVGWQDNNDWMDYNVNLASAGTYTINFRVASYFTGAQFQMRNAAGTILKTMTVPNTGSFQNWQTITTTVTLPAGQQTIRIFTNAANGGWNFNWMEFIGSTTTTDPLPNPDPTPTTPSAVSIKLEAESYTQMNGVKTENTQDAGGGLNVGWQDDNDWMDYAVNMASAGTYTVKFRVASYFTGAQFQVRNSAGSVLATVTVPNTSSFQTWTTISASVTLPAGQQTLRLHTSAANGGWNINWWEISTPSTGTATATGTVEEVKLSQGTMDVVSVKEKLLLKVNNSLTGSMQVEIIGTDGTTVKQFQLSKSKAGSMQSYLSTTGITPGTYQLKLTMNDYTTSKNIDIR